MADSELDALRAKRLAELQQQQGGQQRSMGADPNDRNAAEEQRQKQDEMRNAMLSSLLTQEARARLNTIALTKPEKGRMVEEILIQNARRGAFGGGKVRRWLWSPDGNNDPSFSGYGRTTDRFTRASEQSHGEND